MILTCTTCPAKSHETTVRVVPSAGQHVDSDSTYGWLVPAECPACGQARTSRITAPDTHPKDAR